MSLNKQRGATFISWLVGAGVFIFFAILTLKLAPVFLEYKMVRGIINDVAADAEMVDANKRMIDIKLGKYLDINALDDHLTSKNFDIVRIPKTKNGRKLTVEYEVRKPWFANLDFVAKFKYAKEIGSIE